MDTEEYLLLILSDGNLPTGSFVASAGLESYNKHGHPVGASPTLPTSTVNFMRDSLQSYIHSAVPFARDTHQLVEQLKDAKSTDNHSEKTLKSILEIDDLYDKMTLNHVARRASKTQGIALLTLYARGFSRPSILTSGSEQSNLDVGGLVGQLVNTLKLTIRKGETPGHLPVCWGVLTAALGLSSDRSMELHLFLHARSILSSAIRLNTLGPYSAQQLILHVVRPLVRELASAKPVSVLPREAEDESGGAANTWPLGEILAARHDLQHSRIFNS